MAARRDVTPQPPRLPDGLTTSALPGHDAGDELDLHGARFQDEAIRARWVEVAESEPGRDAGALDVRDSVLRTCELSNLAVRRGSLRRTVLEQSRLLGLALAEGDLQDLRVTGGTMMLASFDQARLQRVAFDEVDLREASFSDARLDAVTFLGCDLEGTDFRGARLRDCVLRGSALDGVVGVDSLRGLAMPWPDLVASTGALAEALGIAVTDDD